MGFTFNCVVFDGYEPNAFAAHRDGEHWSAMSTGMIYVLAELAVRLAAVFPIHDPDEPPLDLEAAAGAGFRYDREDFRQSHAEAARFFNQADGFGYLRRRLLNTLWLDSQVLIWRHELFHGALGHTRFLDEIFGLGALNEGPTNRADAPDEEVLPILRALEFHADWAAFGSVLKMANSNYDAAGIDLQKRFGVQWRAASMIAAVLILPAYFAGAEHRGAPAGVTHPSAAARLSIFLSRVSEFKDPALRDAWRRGSALALDVFDRLSRQHDDFAIFGELLSDAALAAGDAERIACIDVFDVLQDDLLPFAALPLGHPHQGSVDPLPEEA